MLCERVSLCDIHKAKRRPCLKRLQDPATDLARGGEKKGKRLWTNILRLITEFLSSTGNAMEDVVLVSTWNRAKRVTKLLSLRRMTQDREPQSLVFQVGGDETHVHGNQGSELGQSQCWTHSTLHLSPAFEASPSNPLCCHPAEISRDSALCVATSTLLAGVEAGKFCLNAELR